MLRVLCATGLLGACGAIYGGPFSRIALAVCYGSYLSLDMATGLIFLGLLALRGDGTVALLARDACVARLRAVAAPAAALTWRTGSSSSA